MWFAKRSLVAPTMRGNSLVSREFLDKDIAQKALPDLPERPPYFALAQLWHQYSHETQPNYVYFLKSLAKSRGIELRSILDLACGAGTLTERLARTVPDLVGLDASESMLVQARRRCSTLNGVQFRQDDFRAFDLGRHFDAVVCAHDSLNYVANVEELGQVFRCVAQHLCAGGLFTFDTFTRKGMGRLSGQYVHANVDGQRMAMYFDYDRRQQKEKATVMLSEGIEMHYRIPIDPEDVEKAIVGSGLKIDDFFSDPIVPGKWFVGSRCYFVLSKST